MAFFATLDELPVARKQWGNKPRGNPNPRRPKPPIRPPRRSPPQHRQPQRFCKQGSLPMLIPVPDMNHRIWRCSPIPYAYLSLINDYDMIRGWPKPSKVPFAVIEDRTHKPARRVGYVKAKAKNDMNENVEGN